MTGDCIENNLGVKRFNDIILNPLAQIYVPKGFSNQIPELFTVNFQDQTIHLDNNRDLTPNDPDVFTPTLTEMRFGEFLVPNMIPMIPDISTPTLSVMEFGDNKVRNHH